MNANLVRAAGLQHKPKEGAIAAQRKGLGDLFKYNYELKFLQNKEMRLPCQRKPSTGGNWNHKIWKSVLGVSANKMSAESL